MFVLHVGTELDLCLNSRKLAGLFKGHGVGSVQNVIPGLNQRQETRADVTECNKSANKDVTEGVWSRLTFGLATEGRFTQTYLAIGKKR